MSASPELMVTVAMSWLHEPLQVTENILWLPVSATGIVVFHADLEMNATIIEMSFCPNQCQI